MAPVLMCPECKTKHPLDSIGVRTAFPCTGCGRTLKVPGAPGDALDPPTSATSATSRTPSDPPTNHALITQVPLPRAAPIAPPRPPSAAAPGPPPGMPSTAPPAEGSLHGVPPRSVRFALWIVAIPLAFFFVFGLARVFGVLSTNDITDVALAEGWQRFMPIVRLLPIVALVTAALVHGGVYGIARMRSRRSSTPKPQPSARLSGRSVAPD